VDFSCGTNGCEWKLLARNPKGKRPLGRPKYRQKNNIRMHVSYISSGYMG
jgi:hypothetical protein